MIFVRFLILTKVFNCSGCQMLASLTDITSITANTNKLIDNLGKMFTLIWIFCWKRFCKRFCKSLKVKLVFTSEKLRCISKCILKPLRPCLGFFWNSPISVALFTDQNVIFYFSNFIQKFSVRCLIDWTVSEQVLKSRPTEPELKNSGLWKTWIMKSIDLEKPEPSKTWPWNTQTLMRFKIRSNLRELYFQRSCTVWLVVEFVVENLRTDERCSHKFFCPNCKAV